MLGRFEASLVSVRCIRLGVHLFGIEIAIAIEIDSRISLGYGVFLHEIASLTLSKDIKRLCFHVQLPSLFDFDSDPDFDWDYSNIRIHSKHTDIIQIKVNNKITVSVWGKHPLIYSPFRKKLNFHIYTTLYG